MTRGFHANWRLRVEAAYRHRAFRNHLFQAIQPILLAFIAIVGAVVFGSLDQTHEALLALAESAQIESIQLVLYVAVLFLFSALFATAHASFSRNSDDPEAFGLSNDAKLAEKAGLFGWNPVRELRFWRGASWALATVAPWVWAFMAMNGADQILAAHITVLGGVEKAAAEVADLQALRAQLWLTNIYWVVGAMLSLSVLWVLYWRGPRIVAITLLLAVGVWVTVAPQIAFDLNQALMIQAGPMTSGGLALFTIIGALVLLGWIAQVARQSYLFVLVVFATLVIAPQIDWLTFAQGPDGRMAALLLAVVVVFFLFGLGEPRWRAAAFVAFAGAGFAAVGGFGGDEEGLRLEQVAKAQAIKGRSSLPYEENFDTLFLRWLREAREARNWDEDKPFPVFIFAARGGGAYAAAAAATALARFEHEAPGFHRHIFAISGVSGGAVGATIFNDLMRSKEIRPDCAALAGTPPPAASFKGGAAPISATFKSVLETRIAEIIAANHVGAALGALPADVFTKMIRGTAPSYRVKALNSSFVAALERARPAEDQIAAADCLALPNLVLNMTSSETGERVAHSPFPLEETVGPLTLKSFRERVNFYARDGLRLEDIDLETESLDDKRSLEVRQALQSATFPLIVPAATFSIKKDTPENEAGEEQGLINFVDGGYSDSSGASTAFDLIRALEKIAARHEANAELHLIALNSGLPVDATTLDEGSGTRLRDLGAIATTVLNLRSLRSHVALRDAVFELKDRSRTHLIEIDDQLFKFALGWSLSQSTIRSINAIIGDPAFLQDVDDGEALRLESECYTAKELEDDKALRSSCAGVFIRRNSCAVDRLAGLVDLARTATHPSCANLWE